MATTASTVNMFTWILLLPKTVFSNSWARPTKTGIFESNASIIRFGGKTDLTSVGGKITDLTSTIINMNVTRMR